MKNRILLLLTLVLLLPTLVNAKDKVKVYLSIGNVIGKWVQQVFILKKGGIQKYPLMIKL